MTRIKRLVFRGLLLVVFSQGYLLAQSTYSTYSILGVGDYIDPAVPAAMGMGGLGISNASYWYLNNTNPALLYYNRVALFSAGILAESKTITQQGFEPVTAGSGNLNHLAMAFPLSRNKWSFSLGIQPYSSVNYAFIYDGFTTSSNSADNSLILNEGSGGITSLNFAAGGLIFKGLSVGVKASYLFSGYEKEFSSVANAAFPSYIALYLQRQSVNDFTLGFGMAYKRKIGDNQLGLGLIYDLKTAANGTEFVRIEQRNLSNVIIFSDTLANNVDNVLNLPANLGLGISYGRPNNWMVGFDFKTQDWTNLDVPASASPQKFTKSRKYVLGGEYTPNFLDVKSYLKRVTFRAGFTYEEKPYWLADTQIKEFGINFGWSLPVSSFSGLDFGIMIGNRGTTDNNLVREDFFKVYFGATFNDNRWFIRPKFN
jgi:hypothetical protein